jgi:NitT/TauT family transport system ATP-binding protein
MANLDRQVSGMTDPERNAEPDGASGRPFIAISDLRMWFGTVQKPLLALDGVTLAVREQEFFSIVGPSGCGKSTLLLLIAGLLAPSAGELLIRGQQVNGPYTEAAMVFQQDNLLEWRTVLTNVVLPAEIRRLPRSTYHQRALELLAFVGLRGFEQSYPHQLSGGMRQRAALCRALLCDLPLLLMDEPFGALDALTREEQQVMLQRIWLQDQKTVVFVTHDIREAVLLSDRVAVMSPRPGVIRDVVPIELPRPRARELTETVEFNRYVGRLRRSLESAHVQSPPLR